MLSDGRTMAKTINELYFSWMVRKCRCEDRVKLLGLLDSISFTYIIPLDANRAEDGIDLRYRFAYENAISESEIHDTIDRRPCSVLEMMVALAIRCEETIMSDPEYGDRTYIWFKEMLTSLGFDRIYDDNFVREYCVDHIYRFLNRDYKPTGEGGLFTVFDRGDLRHVEIWYQAMWYLTSYIYKKGENHERIKKRRS